MPRIVVQTVDQQLAQQARGTPHFGHCWRTSENPLEVRAAFADRAEFDELDGLTVALRDGSWFNLRPSNTEPLLRLNVEAADDAEMSDLRDEVLAIVRA